MPISLLFAVIATVLNSIAGLMQSNATRHVDRHRSLATQPWYVAGLVVDGCGWVCTVGARIVWGSTLRRIDRFAIGACLIGLVLVSSSAGAERPATGVWVSTLVRGPLCAGIAYSRALELTGLAQVTAVMLVTEVVAPGLIGIALLGDAVRAGWWWPMLVGLGIAVAGIATLAGSPSQQPPPRMIHYRRSAT